jgi:hypothetical protein
MYYTEIVVYTILAAAQLRDQIPIWLWCWCQAAMARSANDVTAVCSPHMAAPKPPARIRTYPLIHLKYQPLAMLRWSIRSQAEHRVVCTADVSWPALCFTVQSTP